MFYYYDSYYWDSYCSAPYSTGCSCLMSNTCVIGMLDTLKMWTRTASGPNNDTS